jgi:hypothetical protein
VMLTRAKVNKLSFPHTIDDSKLQNGPKISTLSKQCTILLFPESTFGQLYYNETYPTRWIDFDATERKNQSLPLFGREFTLQFGAEEVAHQNHEAADNKSLVCISRKLVIRR